MLSMSSIGLDNNSVFKNRNGYSGKHQNSGSSAEGYNPIEICPLPLRLTGLIVAGKGTLRMWKVRIRLILLLLLAGHQILHNMFLIFDRILRCDACTDRTSIKRVWTNLHASNAYMFIGFILNMQFITSIIFLLYWQLSGRISKLSEQGLKIEIHKGILFIYIFVFLISMSTYLAMAVEWYITHDIAKMRMENELNFWLITICFYYIRLVGYYYAFFVWLVVLVLYVSRSRQINYEMEKLNKKLDFICSRINCNGLHDSCQFLESIFDEYLELGKIISATNKIFGLYAFIMLLSNVPMTVFSILSFVISLQEKYTPWKNFSFAIVDTLICVMQFVGLTKAPAKIKTNLRSIESVLFRHASIWHCTDGKIQHFLINLIQFSNQTNLGITLWGFAVITKPLILTLISLALTYLMSMIQYKLDQEEGPMDKVDLIGNLTRNATMSLNAPS